MFQDKKNILLISIIPQKVTNEEILSDLTELQSLVIAYGGVVTAVVTQRREVTDRGRYIGKGKISEVARIITEKKISIVVLNAIVKPGQLYDIKSVFHTETPGIEVWDRIDLILNIFSLHAKTSEAKLQIDLAAMRHMGPLIYGMGMVLSRQSGGIGTRGIGETNTELMRRHWRDQIKKTEDRLKKLSEERYNQLERRRKMGLKTISIVGYTNAGKTSLYNALTGKKKLVRNALFATLDSSVGKIFLTKSSQEILLSDTIGFIKNLPTELINAFKSTLMEAIHADLLLIVVDSSEPGFEKKIQVVESIIQELGIAETKRMYVFNKIDASIPKALDKMKRNYGMFEPQFVSTKSGTGISGLLDTMSDILTDEPSSVSL